MLQLVGVMLITPLACFVTMVSVCVHWASRGHSVTSVRTVGSISPATVVSYATVSSWEVNQTFAINALVYVTALMGLLVICATAVRSTPS